MFSSSRFTFSFSWSPILSILFRQTHRLLKQLNFPNPLKLVSRFSFNQSCCKLTNGFRAFFKQLDVSLLSLKCSDCKNELPVNVLASSTFNEQLVSHKLSNRGKCCSVLPIFVSSVCRMMQSEVNPVKCVM